MKQNNGNNKESHTVVRSIDLKIMFDPLRFCNENMKLRETMGEKYISKCKININYTKITLCHKNNKKGGSKDFGNPSSYYP